MDILEQDRGRHFDPEVLDTFGTVARKLYDSYVGRVSDDLREELTSVVMTYFSAGMETLRYGDDS